ncbi:phage protease [Dyella terrae]|uniref:phage protease n=1 Tax=Dyella terrae TaxID=522259 RepID=UPI001EFC80E1|nr:phage protease [Dyella terrae]ULU26600.1 phage protein [Dyella terrae]
MDIAQPLAIFRAGRHTAVDGRQVDVSPADLAEIARNYDAANDGAPLVVGHPSIDAPAYGWVQQLRVEGDVLLAQPHQVAPEFAEAVNAGRYKKISASLYMPNTPGNPKPGQFYLRHVGFLGAAAPAVKGLPAASFAEGDQVTVEFADENTKGLGAALAQLFRGLRAHLSKTDPSVVETLPDDALASLESSSAATVATPTAAFAEHHTTEEEPMSQNDQAAADFAARETALNTRDADLKAREERIANQEKQARRNDAADFAENLVKEGRLLPREKASVVELLLALPGADAPISFAEGETTVSKPAADAFRELLKGLPTRVHYGRELSRDNGSNDEPVHFAAPVDATVDRDRLALLEKAKAYQAQHPNTSLVDAVRAVGG